MPGSSSSRRRPGTLSRALPRKLGTVRRSQLITTYGVGAMIAIDNESFIVAGLDSWDLRDTTSISEPRLAHFLGVRSFRLPPTPDPDRGVDGVRVRRFPEIYSCPTCNALQLFARFNSLAGQARCPDCDTELVPSRFVLGCDNGHIEDFPYWKWIHRDSEHSGGRCGGDLSLRSQSDSASLRSVVISCSCGVPDVSMEGAFRTSELKKLRIRCEGKRPWLRDARVEPCDQQPRTMQRGSSSTWHPIMRSALSIPPWGEGIYAVIERHNLFGAPDDVIRWCYSNQLRPREKHDVEVEDLIRVVRDIEEQERSSTQGHPQQAAGFESLRKDEYKRLVREHRSESGAPTPFENEKPLGDPTPIQALGVDQSMLVKRLREVRVLASFSRGALPTEADSSQRHAALSLNAHLDWLPAMEVSGEGVFLRLNEEKLQSWEAAPTVIARSNRIRRNHLALLHSRATAGRKAKRVVPDSPVTPRFLLLHTLAHVLINEWSLDGGYPAAALRERLYADENMAGLLIYTATSDSAGSLGGVVAQGEIVSLASSLHAAIERAGWCSNDPLCMETEASGADSVNLAACHACVLLPETSCETNNSFLDRALLVSAPSEGVPGYFTPF
ncbi:DUF1998 domain-containing protein [Kribbella sp. NBC_00662]|uniref:DrmB family protein n=1 Tax=Kribbella sp. NBC_00662 TaxID=2975969 RepID=UPI00325190E1